MEVAFTLDKDDLGTFVQNILGLPPKTTTRLFTAFQVLSLSNISFTSGTNDLAHTFNFGLHSSLKLRFCPE